MSIEGQGYFFTIYFPGFVCFVLYRVKISGERLQDHWSSGLEKRMGAHMLCFRKKYDPDICHFLIVLHDQCNLDFEYSKTYKTL